MSRVIKVTRTYVANALEMTLFCILSICFLTFSFLSFNFNLSFSSNETKVRVSASISRSFLSFSFFSRFNFILGYTRPVRVVDHACSFGDLLVNRSVVFFWGGLIDSLIL